MSHAAAEAYTKRLAAGRDGYRLAAACEWWPQRDKPLDGSRGEAPSSLYVYV